MPLVRQHMFIEFMLATGPRTADTKGCKTQIGLSLSGLVRETEIFISQQKEISALKVL